MAKNWCQLWVFGLLFSLSSQAEVYRYNYSADGSNLPPFSWYNPRDDQLQGYISLLVDAVVKDVGFTVETVPINDSVESGPAAREALRRVIAGESAFYFLPRDYIPPSDDLEVFPDPAFQLEISVFAGSDNPLVFKRWQDLEGLRGGNWNDRWVSGLQDFDHYASKHLSIKRYPDNKALVAALVAGELDYIIGVKKPLLVELRLLGKHNQFVPVGDPIATVPVHWFISKQSSLYQQVGEIKAAFAQVRQSGHTQLIMQKAMKQYVHFRGLTVPADQ